MSLPYLNKSFASAMEVLCRNVTREMLGTPEEYKEIVKGTVKGLKGSQRFKKKVANKKTLADLFSTFVEYHEESSEDEIVFELAQQKNS